MKIFTFLILLAGGAVCARAQDAAKPFEPKHKSSFSGSPADHNPFWPIGWVSPVDTGKALDEAPAAAIHAADFTVTSILLNQPAMAVINGTPIAEGEVAKVTIGAKAVIIELRNVQDGQVVIRCQNQDFVVPLHRNEEISKGDSVAGQAALAKF